MKKHLTLCLAVVPLGACIAPATQTQSEPNGESAAALSAGPSAGEYQLMPSYASAQCMEVGGGNTSPGGMAQTWSCAQSLTPNWNIVPISSGVYEIRQALGNNCLTAWGGGFANGTSLGLWGCNGQVGSRWNIVPNGSYDTIRSIDNSSKCFDVSASGSANGTKMQVWDCSGAANQQFQLSSVAASGSTSPSAPAPAPSPAPASSSPAISAALSVSDLGNQYAATLTVSNSSTTNVNSWQVALNLGQSRIDQSPSYGGIIGINNGSVYYAGGLAILTPANGATLTAGGSVQVKFTGDKTGGTWTPSIVSVDGIAGSSAPMQNDGVDYVAQAAATAALDVIVAWESGRTQNTLVDFGIIDAHSFTLSSDGSQIVFDGWGPGGWSGYVTESAISALALAQMDPSVASYLVSGLLSCFADVSPALVYSVNGAALRNWSYTTTAQDITLGTTSGTNNVSRVGGNVNGTAIITLTETVNPNSEDANFGLASTLPYTDFVTNQSDPSYTKFHGGNAVPCSPFNGPAGAPNPYLLISVNGHSVGARQQLPVTDCPYVNQCTSTLIIDPVPYAQPGAYYDAIGNMIGTQANPFQLQPTVLFAVPAHADQWATRTVDGVKEWGTFSKALTVLGTTVYKYVKQM